MKGWCYVMTNPHMQGLVKIGWTSRQPEDRASELFTTGVPDAYEIQYAAECVEADLAEKNAHSIMRSVRVNSSREYFRSPVKDAIAVVRESAQTFGLVSEKFYLVEREEAEKLQKQMAEERLKAVDLEIEQQRNAASARAQQIAFDSWRDDQHKKCRAIYEPLISSTLRDVKWHVMVIAASIVIALISLVLTGQMSIWNIFLGGVVGTIAWSIRDGSKTESTLRIEGDLNRTLEQIDLRLTAVCSNCGCVSKLESATSLAVKCTHCGKWMEAPPFSS